jgi:hypothetical protein
MKQCTRCKISHPAESLFFPLNKGTVDKLGSWCRNCVRLSNQEARLKKRKDKKYLSTAKWFYGLTEAQIEMILEYQNSLCAICQKELAGSKNTHIDHTEIDGFIVVRGILCNACNSLLGAHKDSVESLQQSSNRALRAAEYLIENLAFKTLPVKQ